MSKNQPMNFYDESESGRDISRSKQICQNGPYFMLSEQQKSNINKRLPRGFHLIKRADYEKQYEKNKRRYNPDDVLIDFNPQKRWHNIDLNNPFAHTIQQNMVEKLNNQNSRRAKMVVQSVQGRNRQMEKIKSIIQRFRKSPKYPQLANFLNKIGLMQGINEIESQNRKSLLTIDMFRERFMLVLETAKNNTFEQKIKELIDEMVQLVQCYAEEARKAEFENNIQNIQKSIDKITRYVSESNYYFRKRKKGDKVDNNYSEKEILFIGDLIRKLPKAYLIGLIQIIEDRPVNECGEQQILEIRLGDLTNRKLKDIESYVKGKLIMLHRSRERKAQKIRKKKEERGQISGQEQKIEAEKYEEQNADPQSQFLIDFDNLDEQNEFFDRSFKDNLLPNLGQQSEKKDEPIKRQDQIESDNRQQSAILKDQAQKQMQQEKREEKLNSQEKIDKKEPQPKQSPRNPIQENQDSMNQNDSSDSSMITDEDDSDF